VARGAAQNGKKRSFKYNLSEYAPADVIFTLRGKDFRVTGDPDVEVWKLMLRIDEVLRGTPDEDEEMGLSEALEIGKRLMVDLIREYAPDFDLIRPGDPDFDEEHPEAEQRRPFRIGVNELLGFFTYMTGGPTVADATARAITGNVDALHSGDLPDEDGEGEAGEPQAPLASAKPSSARSRSSRAKTAGKPAGG
jgi:hypothetical protein